MKSKLIKYDKKTHNRLEIIATNETIKTGSKVYVNDIIREFIELGIKKYKS